MSEITAKEFLIERLKLSPIQANTMYEDYIKACEDYAKEKVLLYDIRVKEYLYKTTPEHGKHAKACDELNIIRNKVLFP